MTETMDCGTTGISIGFGDFVVVEGTMLGLFLMMTHGTSIAPLTDVFELGDSDVLMGRAGGDLLSQSTPMGRSQPDQFPLLTL